MNAKQAYKRAGYTGKGADQSACALLSNPKVKDYITKLQGKVEEKFEIRLEDVLKRIEKTGLDEDHKDQLKANDLLVKHLGGYTEKVEMTATHEVIKIYLPEKEK